MRKYMNQNGSSTIMMNRSHKDEIREIQRKNCMKDIKLINS